MKPILMALATAPLALAGCATPEDDGYRPMPSGSLGAADSGSADDLWQLTSGASYGGQCPSAATARAATAPAPPCLPRLRRLWGQEPGHTSGNARHAHSAS